MFDKLKQANELRKMRSQAMEMQKKLSVITQAEKDGDNMVVVSADQKIIKIVVDGQERKDILDLANKAFKEVQKEAAKKMMEDAGGLSGLLKGF